MNVSVEDKQRGLIALWDHALLHWNEEAAHRALLEAADSQNDLAFVAKRYRALLDEGSLPHLEVAEAQLNKITTLAFSRLEASRSEAPQTRRFVTFFALLVSILLISASVYMVTR